MTKLLSILVLVGLAPTPNLALAQVDNVNDCTLIKDPIALRDCILRYGNVRTQPPTTIENNAQSTATQPEPSTDASSDIVEVPPTPTSKRNKPVKRPKQTVPEQSAEATRAKSTPEAVPPLRPNPNDTLTHIEQIDLSKVKR
ncbi:hypothetical protein [Methylobacterium sp. NFXW15]|uniref:hypothetical protein n=1 Tax=Methylobacterium sp. NFXW15 TaxID=2819512 RepID=UPI003CF535FF